MIYSNNVLILYSNKLSSSGYTSPFWACNLTFSRYINELAASVGDSHKQNNGDK
ncbi:MAG TPA: hypothetical protein PKH15_10750 [Bacteroidales bacterium]|nr:hypothetical protein [Bacteroidales bacterium]